MRLILDASNKVIMVGEGGALPMPAAGQTSLDVDDAVAAQYRQIASQTIDGVLYVGGVFSAAPHVNDSPEVIRRAAIETAVTADAQIQALKAMTNAQFDAFWDANVTTAAQAIGILKRLVRVMLVRVL